METLKKFITDGGLKSRKLWFGVGCVLVLAAMVGVAARYAAVIGIYPEFAGAVVGIYGAYVGTNVANRWGAAKHLGEHLANEGDDKADDKEAAR